MKSLFHYLGASVATKVDPTTMAIPTESITDEGFRSRFVTVPKIVADWIGEHRSLRDLDIMDFGCGEGISALSMALNYRPRCVVGVDIMPDPDRCLPVAREQIGLEALPTNLQLYRVEPGKLHDANATFDVIYSWSTFEHVDQRLIVSTLKMLRGCLRKNGLLFIQIAPLYYSAEGSHLSHKIAEPWAHLSTQHNFFFERLAAATPDENELRELWSTFRTLNRVTAAELINHLERTGFRILKKYSTKDGPEPPEKLTAIFRTEILTTNQIVVLAGCS
jgi:SAM-dependent methyltransferase